jgi:hypothetical protein
MRRSAGGQRFIRLLRRAEEHRRRFGSCMHRRHRDESWAEQGEVIFVAWLFIVLQWLLYARVTSQ